MPPPPPGPSTPPTPPTISIRDFRAGIFGDFHGGIASTSRGAIVSNGAAVIDGTYRCCADTTGALIPLPARAVAATQALLPEGNAVAATKYTGLAKPANYLLDALALPGLHDLTTGYPGDLSSHWAIAALYGVYFNPGAAAEYMFGKMYTDWTSSLVGDFLMEKAATGTSLSGKKVLAGNLALVRANSGGSGVAITSANLRIALATVLGWNFFRGGAGAMTATEQGYTTVDTIYPGTGAFFPTTAGTNNGTGAIFFTPQPNDPTKIYNYSIGTLPIDSPNLAFGHQGRLIVVQRAVREAYLGTSSVGTNTQYARDIITYTAVDDPLKQDPNSTVGTTEIGEENPTGIGAAASLTGSLLLLVKHAGGAYSVQGDINSPTVSHLPYVESTYGVVSHAVTTPIGVVYGSRQGVYVWSGGETSKKLSEQLDGFFWNHSAIDGEEYAGPRGRFGWLSPWVCVPNNYLYDTRGGGWWRLDRPEDACPDVAKSGYPATGIPYSVYATHPTSGKLFAFPYKTTETMNTAAHIFDPATLASSYSWRSQPLIETRDRLQSFQQIRLVASPGSNTATWTVTVTLTGVDQYGVAQTPVVTTFTRTPSDANGLPVVLQQTITPNFVAMYAQVQVEASATSGAAPKILGLDFFTSERSLTIRD